ncbi:hypothetical protein [Streptomyces sp. NPDC005435]|uniref:hypothetical protein n=1 Tax=Streptomyces sp. NPDC005435 TaxID=3154464 RepID=UPI0034554CBB
MEPFDGHGVNLALLDAVELAHAIAQQDTPESAVRRYEPTMQSRAVTGTWQITFQAQVDAPFPTTLDRTATIDGDTITGSAVLPTGTFPFSGARKTPA